MLTNPPRAQRRALARAAAALGLWLTFTAPAAPAATRAWSDGAAPTSAARALVEEMRHADTRGLDPRDYPLGRLDALAAQTPFAADAYDALLSQAARQFATDLHQGRIDPASVGHHLDVDRQDFDPSAAVARLASAQDVARALDALEPPFRHYALLKHMLGVYRQLAADPTLNRLAPLPARSVKPGGAYVDAPALARLLVALGDGPASLAADVPPQLTPALSAALAAFQSRHGQSADGVLGAATYAALTRPLAARVRQIELTLERWRWLPEKLPSATIIVNIPQFHLYALETSEDDEAHMRQMDVIVGKAFPGRQTPVFTADMRYVVFRPYWDVPPSIARKELLPAAHRNPAYLDRERLQIVRGADDSATVLANTPENLDAVARGAARLRQLPGPNNALGLVKFMLPNPYDVYLHSTPAKALFGRSRRDFSHGCIRVSDPVGLAEYVLHDQPDWTRERIETAMQDEHADSRVVRLKQPIRVFIVYGTALALENGKILFFEDIYGHDARLDRALAARRAARAGAP